MTTRPVLILHGAWHQPAHFDTVVERLRHEGVEVTVPDFAGQLRQRAADAAAHGQARQKKVAARRCSR